MEIIVRFNEIPPDLVQFFEPVSNGALSNVFSINPEPSTDKHYATFPTKLVKRCVLAGTSERGCCPMCGKPWERVVEKERMRQGGTPQTMDTAIAGNTAMASLPSALRVDASRSGMGTPMTTTLGWHPGCECGEMVDSGAQDPSGRWIELFKQFDPVPCVVLDPFVGSGTVLAVTAQLGRHGIGIDLSETYLRDIAIPRLEEILLQPKLFMPEQPAAEVPKQEQLL